MNKNGKMFGDSKMHKRKVLFMQTGSCFDATNTSQIKVRRRNEFHQRNYAIVSVIIVYSHQESS
jgi:hypothetical protein